MKKTWLNVINTILDFGPIIATVLVATLASLRATQAGITSSDMLQLVLVVLALLATTQLIDRFRILRGIDVKVEQLVNMSQNPATAATFFRWKIPDLSDRLSRATAIAVNGLTLSTTINSLYGLLLERLSDNCQIRLLTVNPNHAAIEIATARYHKTQKVDSIRNEAKNALETLESLYGQGDWGDRFQVRHSSFVPPYAIWLLDANSPDAEIWVWLYAFRKGYSPAFHLVPHQDKEWFAFFQNQFELMWQASEPWKVARVEANSQPKNIH